MEMRCVFANGGRAEPIRPRNRKRLRPYMASQALAFSILQNRNSMAAHPYEAGKANCKTEAVFNAEKFYICVSGAISFSASVLLALARTAISIASAGRVPAAVSSCAACRAISANAVS